MTERSITDDRGFGLAPEPLVPAAAPARRRARACCFGGCRKGRLAWTLVAAAIALAGIILSRVDAAPSDGLTEQRRAEHLASFDSVWQIVHDSHWDPEFNGVDWEAARDELRPRFETIESDRDARMIISEMLSRLGQSHFGLIPATEYEALDAERSRAERRERNEPADDADAPEATDDRPGWAGLELRRVGDDILVTGVRAGSPAEAAGVRPGWSVLEADGDPMSDLVALSDRLAGLERADTIAAMLAEGRFGGNVGDAIPVTFLDGSDEERAITLELAASPARMAGLGNLPPAPVEMEERRLNDGIGYFRLSIFFGPELVLPAFKKFVVGLVDDDAPGLIIDLRGNPGGVIVMSSGMINWLIQERGTKLGTLRMRDPVRGPFDIPLVLNPRYKTFKGPIAVLIDEASISNSEIMAAGLRDVGRARLFGTRTAGLVLPSTVERLPNGDGFQYAFASYTSSAGGTLEANGVTPDVSVVPDRASLLLGVDPVLAAAVAWLRDPARTADQP